MTSTTDADWVRLYRLHARPLFRFLVKLTYGDQSEAEDHLQETFLRTWRWLQHQTVDIEAIRPWLFTVARRIAIDAGRARQVRPTEVIIEEMNVLASSDNEIDRLVQAQAVRGALLTLREDHRNALIELFYHEHTAKEAASILGIPEGTVKSRAHYGLRALRQATVAAERERPRRRNCPT
jgi:RNA polymerase sigma-70 factor, ECF subfamily